MEPITSSASKPRSIRTGTRKACSSSVSGSSASMIGWGVGGRVPLYSGNISLRKVPPGGSKATARCVGLRRSSSSSRYFVKPKRMEVSIPFELIIGRRRNA